jgi:hypothetical protein
VCSEAADYGIGDCANCLLHIAWLALAYSAPKQLNPLKRFQEPISVRLLGCKRQGRHIPETVSALRTPACPRCDPVGFSVFAFNVCAICSWLL